MKMLFAPIDARDHNLISVVKHDDHVPLYGNPRSEHNTKIRFAAERSYLIGLKKLQESIAAEFEPKLEDDSSILYSDSFCMTKCPCEACLCKKPNSKEYRELYYT